MPISVLCGCGKRLNVRDELVGRRIKCPSCSETFEARASSAVTTAAPLMPTPMSRRPVLKRGAEAVPRLHVSKRLIALGVAAVLLPTCFFLWHIGPARAQAVWAARQPAAENEVKDVVDRAIQSRLMRRGRFDPHLAHNVPHAIDVTFLLAPLYFTLPDHVGFAGTSTEGAFHGQYHLTTGEIEAEVELGGQSLPGVMIKRGNEVLHATGRTRDGKLSAEVDGQTADPWHATASPIDGE